jgi:hypothetical protein
VRRLLAATDVLGASMVTPSTASALTCANCPLDMLEAQPVAFVGHVSEARDAITVFQVDEGVKGVAAGDVVEVVNGETS